MRDPELFSTGATYHVYNRGVDKRIIFNDDADRLRFLKSIVAFNEVGRRENSSLARVENPPVSDTPCVDVIAYCLMPNHFHLMLRQAVHGGVSEFMHRLGLGYTRYFNKRNGRVGRLLESAYKIKRVKTTLQNRHLPRYIHLNPLDLIGLDWKRQPAPWSVAEPFLMEYRWSSFRHYVGLERQAFIKPDSEAAEPNGPKNHSAFLAAWIERDWNALAAFDNPIPGIGTDDFIE